MHYLFAPNQQIQYFHNSTFQTYPGCNSGQNMGILYNSDNQQCFKKRNQYFEPIIISTVLTNDSLSLCDSKDQTKRIKKPKKSEKATQKDENFGWRNQNKDRNLISGILKNYVFLILEGGKMTKLIEQVSNKYEISNGVSRFHEFMIENFPTKKSYVGIKYMQQILAKWQDNDRMMLILRITLKKYLKLQYRMSVITNSKLKKKNKILMLKKSSKICEQLNLN